MIHDDLPIKNGDFLIATLIYIYIWVYIIYIYIYPRGLGFSDKAVGWGGVGHVTVMFMLR